jgi:hypothetical protein
MSARDEDEQFGAAEDYTRALQALMAEGIPDHHRTILQAHFNAPDQTASAQRLAERVGYASYRAVNLHYGKFAERIARLLGLSGKPLDPNGNAWWLWVLVCWANERDLESGHTAFVLRRPVIEALRRAGIVHEH